MAAPYASPRRCSAEKAAELRRLWLQTDPWLNYSAIARTAGVSRFLVVEVAKRENFPERPPAPPPKPDPYILHPNRLDARRGGSAARAGAAIDLNASLPSLKGK